MIKKSPAGQNVRYPGGKMDCNPFHAELVLAVRWPTAVMVLGTTG